ncbi:MAG: NmrA/HSCARG family protein [Bryobacteraceae bacterium]
MSEIILITGATGQQGGAVARHLTGKGWDLRALVRHPKSPAALALSASGVELVSGDFSESDPLNAALINVYGVFSVQPVMAGKADEEVRYGKRLAKAAQQAGVKHFIYSSVYGARNAEQVPHFASKALIEDYVRTLELPATILQPAGFMENLLPKVRDGIAKGRLITPAAVDVRQPLIAVDDIGAFAAKAFAAPDQYIGRAIPLVGDVASVREQAAVLSRVLGRPIKPGQLPSFLTRLFLGRDLYAMFRWINQYGDTLPFDRDELQRIHPELMSFETWTRKHYLADEIRTGPV